MPDIMIIVSVLSGGMALLSLGAAAWHTWRIEYLQHHTDQGKP